MGLTHQSCGTGVLSEKFNTKWSVEADYTVALAGNPNTGKSTLFNALTGLNQHTGNWPGKTVLRAEGKYFDGDLAFNLVDLPGTYSLLANSAEEQVARDYLCFAKPQATVVVADATCLERNLNLVLQVLEITPKVIVCVNLIDEAYRKKIRIDLKKLSDILGVPVMATNAREGIGINPLVKTITGVIKGDIKTTPYIVRYNDWLEKSIEQLIPEIHQLFGDNFNNRWLALKMLDCDEAVISSLNKFFYEKKSAEKKEELRQGHAPGFLY